MSGSVSKKALEQSSVGVRDDTTVGSRLHKSTERFCGLHRTWTRSTTTYFIQTRDVRHRTCFDLAHILLFQDAISAGIEEDAIDAYKLNKINLNLYDILPQVR